MNRKPSREMRNFARQYNARIITDLSEAAKYPNDAVAFETQNFGWVLSACDADGKRRIIARE